MEKNKRKIQASKKTESILVSVSITLSIYGLGRFGLAVFIFFFPSVLTFPQKVFVFQLLRENESGVGVDMERGCMEFVF